MAGFGAEDRILQGEVARECELVTDTSPFGGVGEAEFLVARISELYKDPHLDPLPFWERGTERQVSLPGMLRLLARMLAP